MSLVASLALWHVFAALTVSHIVSTSTVHHGSRETSIHIDWGLQLLPSDSAYCVASPFIVCEGCWSRFWMFWFLLLNQNTAWEVIASIIPQDLPTTF